MSILLVLEHDNHEMKSINYHVATAAYELNQPIDIIIAGYQCKAVVEEAKDLPNIREILVADHADYQHQLAENIAPLLKQLGDTYEYILMGATTFGKNILPRVAALFDMEMVSDVMTIVSPNTFKRPIYAGNAVAEVRCDEKIKLLTIRATAFNATNKIQNTPNIKNIDRVIQNERSFFETEELTQSKRPELSSARIVVSGGRAFKSIDNFKMLETLADLLGAAIGASRAAVDAGYAPNDYQVGQTGKIIAPDLYIAVGISGAIQHIAGMSDSKVIVAINNDPDAPIFQIADYGLVGDLFKIIPELQSALTAEITSKGN